MLTTTAAQLRLKNLLVPIDFSPRTKSAVRLASAIAEQHDSTIYLANVIESFVHPDIQSPPERQRIRERLDREMRKLFPEQIQQSLDVIVEFGPIPETIVEFAVTERADLVVLGVRAGGAFTRSATHIPWSIAYKIIAEAPCPVLTIRGGHRGENP